MSVRQRLTKDDSHTARKLCERALQLATIFPDQTAYAVLVRPAQLPPSPLDHYQRNTAAAHSLLWWQNAWMLACGHSASTETNGPGRAFAIAEAASRIRNRCVCAASGDHSNQVPDLPFLLVAQAFEDRIAEPSHWGNTLPGASIELPRRIFWRRRSGAGSIIDALPIRADTGSPEQLSEELLAPNPFQTDKHHTDQTNHWGHLSTNSYTELVSEAIDMLHYGNLRKIVLARAVDEHLPNKADIPHILENLHKASDTWTFVYARQLKQGGTFLGATPELLFQHKENQVRTISLAGSRPRGATVADDQQLSAELMSSTKERKEHQLVVEHLADVLQDRCSQLDVPGAPQIRQLAKVQHLETPIIGTLHEANPFDLLAHLQPTPAISGLPTKIAMDYIRKREGLHRGLYTGAMGYITPQASRFIVPLRGGIVDGQQARLFAGAGIIETSDPDAEYAETETKLTAMRTALGIH